MKFNKITLLLILVGILVVVCALILYTSLSATTPESSKKTFNEVKLEIEQFFITNTGDSYYPAWTWNAQESSGNTIETLGSYLEIIGDGDWQSFCEQNSITPAQAATFIEWLAEHDYDDVKVVYQPEQAEFTAWVYFPRTKEGESLDNLILDGGALLHSTGLFIGAPSLETIEFDTIYTACYALGIDTFNWWQTSEGERSILFEVAKP